MADNLWIGSDPEFALVTKNNIPLQAETFIKDPSKRRFMGTDGDSTTAELRPKPTTDPLAHADNIRRLFIYYRNTYKDAFRLNFVPQVYGRRMGGHIHFSVADAWRDTYARNMYRLIENLDICVAIPFMMLEDKKIAFYRKHNGYGTLGEYREQRYGIEYRTLSSWIASEQLTKGILSLAYVVAYETFDTGYKSLLQKQIHGDSIFYSFQNHKIEPFYRLLPEIHREVTEHMSLYPVYKNHIDFIFDNAFAKRQITTGEIKKGWFVPKAKVKRMVRISALKLISYLMKQLPSPQILPYPKMNFVSAERTYISEQVKWLNTVLCNIILADEKTDRLLPEIRDSWVSVGVDLFECDMAIVLYPPWKKHIRIEKMIEVLKDIARSFGYEVFKIQVQNNSEEYDHRRMKMVFSEKIVRNKQHLFEILTFIGLLYSSDAICKAYKTRRTDGKPVTLESLCKELLKPIPQKPIAQHGAVHQALQMDEGRLLSEQLERQHIESMYSAIVPRDVPSVTSFTELLNSSLAPEPETNDGEHE